MASTRSIAAARSSICGTPLSNTECSIAAASRQRGLTALRRPSLANIAAREDHALIRAFAVWRVQHDLVRRERAGRATESSAYDALRLVRAAIELADWARRQGLTLGQCRQEHLDRWLAEGSSLTGQIAPFLSWAVRGGHTIKLEPGSRRSRSQVAPIDDAERLALTSRLLHDDAIDLRDRVAGLLVLIYAQPLTRIVTLTVEDVLQAPGSGVQLRLGAVPVELPEPVSDLVGRLAQLRPSRSRPRLRNQLTVVVSEQAGRSADDRRAPDAPPAPPRDPASEGACERDSHARWNAPTVDPGGVARDLRGGSQQVVLPRGRRVGRYAAA